MIELTQEQEQPAFEDICISGSDIRIRKLRLNDLWQSLKEGYEDYGAKPSSVPLLIIFYPLFALIFTLYSFGQELRYLAFPIVAGFTLIGPIVAVIFFEMSRRRENGQELRWGATLRFIHTSSFAPILALSIIMTLLYVFWLYMAELIYFGIFGDLQPQTAADFVNQLLTTSSGTALIYYGNFVGFLFAFAAMAISIVSFPLALDKPVTSITAISVSVRAFTSNFRVMAVWAFIVLALLSLGAALFLIGLTITLPVLGHATWHLYRKTIES